MSDPLGNRPWPEPPFDFGLYQRPPALELPGGARTAVVVYLNMEYFRYDLPSPMALTPGQADRLPDIINYAWRDYGTRAGVWRVIDVLEKHGVKFEELAVPSGNLTMQQMVARQVDMGTYAGPSFAIGHDKGGLVAIAMI